MVEKRTIQREVFLSGVGIHSGQRVSLTLRPSACGRIVFRRLDLGGREIEVDPLKVESKNSSSLISEDCAVQTVEHLLAVLHILGIDSIEIDLDGGEIPVMDGSALPLAHAILEPGLSRLPSQKKVVKILREHTLREGQASLSFSPDQDFRLTYSIEFPHPAIGSQEFSFAATRQGFLAEIAPARTFGFLKDVLELWKRGLAKGGTLENAVILDDEKVINGPLRFPDEFVRHKILDLIGDLALWGHPFLGHFKAYRAGHSLHLKTIHFLLRNPDFWAFEESEAPSFLDA
ncbi:MAG: UDP-3-O-acyl-N-acetylglucosamine deacetylase [Clostridiales bacterium]|nr:UDP-3-O-acyl-N-acetylglucosamine deacetylase [Clostridiales bacterium]